MCPYFGSPAGTAMTGAVRAYLVTGNPGSGKTTVCFLAVDTDSLACWTDDAGRRSSSRRRRTRRGWSRVIAAEDSDCLFCCGIVRKQDEMLDLFDRVFLLVIDSQTQDARLDRHGSSSPPRTEAAKAQVRAGRPIFQAKMLAHGAMPIDGIVPPAVVVDSLLAHLP